MLQQTYRVFLSGTDYQATGEYNIESGQLTVYEGSKIKMTENPSFRIDYPNIATMKDNLVKQGIIVDNEFTKNYEFNDVFHASTIVSTNDISGKKAWSLRDGKTIEALEQTRKNINHFLTFYEKHKVTNLKEKRQKIDKRINEFQELFPLERFKNLTLEEYDKLGSKESLMYMVEHGTDEVFSGFLGNNSNKLFFQKQDMTYDCSEHFKNKYPGKSIEEMFEIHRDNLYEIVSEFNKDKYVMLPPNQANTIKGKLIMLYHPDELIYINSKRGYEKKFDYFGLDSSNTDSVMLNIRMQKFLQDIGVNNKDILETSMKLWDYYKEYIEFPNGNGSNNKFDHIFISDDYIKKIIRVLKRKKAIILRGVPGVGKTFIIKDLIRQSFKNIGEDGIETIQFHQSYSYEEFIEGLKPQMDGSFKPEKGIFYEIAKRAENDQENNYFLVIDEINRGNISKIFGELMMLIENDKRDNASLKLAYSKEPFSVPGNLYIIGTMNTADRSLSLIDYALRRRFSFLTLEPAYGTVKFNEFLSKAMELTKENISQINDAMIHVNSIIEERLDKNFLIGHSYFITDDETIDDFDTWFGDIVEFDIMPMIEEYFFDDEDTVQEIRHILGDINAQSTN